MIADCSEHGGAALVRLGVAWVEAYRLVQVAQCALELPLPDEGPAAKEKGLRVVRVDANGLAIFPDRTVEFTGQFKVSAAPDVGICESRIERDRLAEVR